MIEILRQLVAERGAPRSLRSDNGPELLAYAVQDWLPEAKIELQDAHRGPLSLDLVGEDGEDPTRDEPASLTYPGPKS